MIRRAFTGLAAVSASVAAFPAVAADSTISGAISATIAQHLDAAGLGALKGQTLSAVAVPVAGASSWIAIMNELGWPTPFNLGGGKRIDDGRFSDFGGFGGGGGGFDGGGASGDWDCPKIKYRLDAQGNLVVPSLPLATGRAVTPGDPIQLFYTTFDGSNVLGADSEKAMALWGIHNWNMGLGTDKRNWFGAWNRDSNGTYVYSTIAYVGANGNVVPRQQKFLNYPLKSYSAQWPQNKPCPSSGSQGGDFHFYPRGDASYFTNCTMYAPNFSLSPSGYIYPADATVAQTQVDTWLGNSAAYGACPLDVEVIRKLADDLFRRAANKAGYTGAAYTPIQTQDVRNCGKDVLLKDVTEDPTAIPANCASPVAPSPEATASPTPSPSPTASPSGTTINEPDPGIADPTTSLADPTFSAFDWGFPTLSLALGSPSCPTYSFEALDQTFTLDSHCPFIEQNRALIAAFMIILFTVAAGRIILGA